MYVKYNVRLACKGERCVMQHYSCVPWSKDAMVVRAGSYLASARRCRGGWWSRGRQGVTGMGLVGCQCSVALCEARRGGPSAGARG